MDPVKTDNEGELTSTMDNVITVPSKDEKSDTSSDATPTSSTDANIRPAASHIALDDPISSTSSDSLDQLKVKMDKGDSASVNTHRVSTDNEADLLDITNITNSEKITEDVEDLVHDLESLLGESTDSFNVTSNLKFGKKDTSSRPGSGSSSNDTSSTKENSNVVVGDVLQELEELTGDVISENSTSDVEKSDKENKDEETLPVESLAENESTTDLPKEELISQEISNAETSASGSTIHPKVSIQDDHSNTVEQSGTDEVNEQKAFCIQDQDISHSEPKQDLSDEVDSSPRGQNCTEDPPSKPEEVVTSSERDAYEKNSENGAGEKTNITGSEEFNSTSDVDIVESKDACEDTLDSKESQHSAAQKECPTDEIGAKEYAEKTDVCKEFSEYKDECSEKNEERESECMETTDATNNENCDNINIENVVDEVEENTISNQDIDSTDHPARTTIEKLPEHVLDVGASTSPKSEKITNVSKEIDNSAQETFINEDHTAINRINDAQEDFIKESQENTENNETNQATQLNVNEDPEYNKNNKNVDESDLKENFIGQVDIDPTNKPKNIQCHLTESISEVDNIKGEINDTSNELAPKVSLIGSNEDDFSKVDEDMNPKNITLEEKKCSKIIKEHKQVEDTELPVEIVQNVTEEILQETVTENVEESKKEKPSANKTVDHLFTNNPLQQIMEVEPSDETDETTINLTDTLTMDASSSDQTVVEMKNNDKNDPVQQLTEINLSDKGDEVTINLEAMDVSTDSLETKNKNLEETVQGNEVLQCTKKTDVKLQEANSVEETSSEKMCDDAKPKKEIEKQPISIEEQEIIENDLVEDSEKIPSDVEKKIEQQAANSEAEKEENSIEVSPKSEDESKLAAEDLEEDIPKLVFQEDDKIDIELNEEPKTKDDCKIETGEIVRISECSSLESPNVVQENIFPSKENETIVSNSTEEETNLENSSLNQILEEPTSAASRDNLAIVPDELSPESDEPMSATPIEILSHVQPELAVAPVESSAESKEAISATAVENLPNEQPELTDAHVESSSESKGPISTTTVENISNEQPELTPASVESSSESKVSISTTAVKDLSNEQTDLAPASVEPSSESKEPTSETSVESLRDKQPEQVIASVESSPESSVIETDSNKLTACEQSVKPTEFFEISSPNLSENINECTESMDFQTTSNTLQDIADETDKSGQIIEPVGQTKEFSKTVFVEDTEISEIVRTSSTIDTPISPSESKETLHLEGQETMPESSIEQAEPQRIEPLDTHIEADKLTVGESIEIDKDMNEEVSEIDQKPLEDERIQKPKEDMNPTEISTKEKPEETTDFMETSEVAAQPISISEGKETNTESVKLVNSLKEIPETSAVNKVKEITDANKITIEEVREVAVDTAPGEETKKATEILETITEKSVYPVAGAVEEVKPTMEPIQLSSSNVPETTVEEISKEVTTSVDEHLGPKEEKIALEEIQLTEECKITTKSEVIEEDETALAVASLEGIDMENTALPLSEKEKQEMEALRQAVESISDTNNEAINEEDMELPSLTVETNETTQVNQVDSVVDVAEQNEDVENPVDHSNKTENDNVTVEATQMNEVDSVDVCEQNKDVDDSNKSENESSTVDADNETMEVSEVVKEVGGVTEGIGESAKETKEETEATQSMEQVSEIEESTNEVTGEIEKAVKGGTEAVEDPNEASEEVIESAKEANKVVEETDENVKEVNETPRHTNEAAEEANESVEISEADTKNDDEVSQILNENTSEVTTESANTAANIELNEEILPDSSQSFSDTEPSERIQDDREKESKSKSNERSRRHKKSSDAKMEELSTNVEIADKEKPYSPKVTIKLKIPDEEVSTTSNSENESSKGSLKMTITKQSNTMHSILKVEQLETPQEPEEPLPKLKIKSKPGEQVQPKMSTRSSKQVHQTPTVTQKCSSPRITIKPLVKPETLSPLKIKIGLKVDESTKKHSPKLNIKPIPKQEEESKEVPHSPRKVLIKPISKPDVEKEPPNISTKLNIKPIKKPEEDENDVDKIATKITFKPIVKPSEPDSHADEVEDDIKKRIVLKINKGNLPAKESRKREHPPDDEKAEKLAKITVKFSKGGGHPHIVQQPEESQQKRPHEEPNHLEKNKKQKIEQDSNVPTRLKQKEHIEAQTETKKNNPSEPDSETNDNPNPKQQTSDNPGHGGRGKHKDTNVSSPIESKRTKLKESKQKENNLEIIKTEDVAESPIAASPVSTTEDTDDGAVHNPVPQPILPVATPDVSMSNPSETESPIVPILTPPQPRKRGRPRKIPLEQRPGFETPSPQSTTSSSSRPKRSCRGQSALDTLGLKPRKPRGSRGRGRPPAGESRAILMKPEKSPK